eukprot:scaffold53052_cov53-Cyclotella_meneghiniana.AAC.7
MDKHQVCMGFSIDIEMQCRWRSDRAKGGKTVKRSMLHTYAEVRNMKTTLLRPSQALMKGYTLGEYVVNKKRWRGAACLVYLAKVPSEHASMRASEPAPLACL